MIPTKKERNLCMSSIIIRGENRPLQLDRMCYAMSRLEFPSGHISSFPFGFEKMFEFSSIII